MKALFWCWCFAFLFFLVGALLLMSLEGATTQRLSGAFFAAAFWVILVGVFGGWRKDD
jgi:surface polysaccharide O-acyltransferase-like enzyme